LLLLRELPQRSRYQFGRQPDYRTVVRPEDVLHQQVGLLRVALLEDSVDYVLDGLVPQLRTLPADDLLDDTEDERF